MSSKVLSTCLRICKKMNTKNTLSLLKVTLLIVVSICLEVYNNNNNHPSLNLSVYFFLFLLFYILFLCRELTCGERNNFKSNNHQVHRKEFESEWVRTLKCVWHTQQYWNGPEARVLGK